MLILYSRLLLTSNVINVASSRFAARSACTFSSNGRFRLSELQRKIDQHICQIWQTFANMLQFVYCKEYHSYKLLHLLVIKSPATSATSSLRARAASRWRTTSGGSLHANARVSAAVII